MAGIQGVARRPAAPVSRGDPEHCGDHRAGHARERSGGRQCPRGKSRGPGVDLAARDDRDDRPHLAARDARQGGAPARRDDDHIHFDEHSGAAAAYDHDEPAPDAWNDAAADDGTSAQRSLGQHDDHDHSARQRRRQWRHHDDHARRGPRNSGQHDDSRTARLVG
jgi:hypothetical protein